MLALNFHSKIEQKIQIRNPNFSPKSFIVLIVLLCIIFGQINFGKTNFIANNKNNFTKLNEFNLNRFPLGSSFYSNIEPVNCSDESDLLTLAGVNGWPGSGQYGDPIIISGISINANYKNNSILIENSKLYVIIKDSLFRNSLNGIKFSNSSNIVIQNCTIENNINGIYIKDNEIGNKQNITIKDNTVFNSTERGIVVSHGDNILIDGNSIINTGFQGMNIADSSNFIIQNNFINVSGVDGIRIGLLTGENRLIYNNSIYNCGFRGLGIEVTNYVNISRNLLMYNHLAFRFEGSGYINCSDNNFIYNDEPAWIGEGGSYFTRNNFISYSKWHITDDRRPDDPKNIFILNYWSGIFDEDLNNDGVYDHSYNGSFQDYYIDVGDIAPVVYLYPIDYDITIPSIIQVSFAVLYENTYYTAGIITLKWTSTIYSDNNEVDHYELFIKSNNGAEWIPINRNISDLEYTVDTKIYDDGFYQFKLVAIDSNQRTSETNTTILYFYNHEPINLTVSHTKFMYNIITESMSIKFEPSPFNPFLSLDNSNETYDFFATMYYSIDGGKTWIFYEKQDINKDNTLKFAETKFDKFFIPLTFIKIKVVIENSLGFHYEWISERYFVANLPAPLMVIVLIVGIYYLFPLIFAITSKIDYIERLSNIEGGGRFEYQVPDEKKIRANKLRLIPIVIITFIDLFYISFRAFYGIDRLFNDLGMLFLELIIISMLIISYLTTIRSEERKRLLQDEMKKAQDSEGKIKRDGDEIKLTLTQKIISFIYLKDVGKKKKKKRTKGKKKKHKESVEEETELESFADKLDEYEKNNDLSK